MTAPVKKHMKYKREVLAEGTDSNGYYRVVVSGQDGEYHAYLFRHCKGTTLTRTTIDRKATTFKKAREIAELIIKDFICPNEKETM